MRVAHRVVVFLGSPGRARNGLLQALVREGQGPNISGSRHRAVALRGIAAEASVGLSLLGGAQLARRAGRREIGVQYALLFCSRRGVLRGALAHAVQLHIALARDVDQGLGLSLGREILFGVPALLDAFLLARARLRHGVNFHVVALLQLDPACQARLVREILFGVPALLDAFLLARARLRHGVNFHVVALLQLDPARQARLVREICLGVTLGNQPLESAGALVLGGKLLLDDLVMVAVRLHNLLGLPGGLRLQAAGGACFLRLDDLIFALLGDVGQGSEPRRHGRLGDLHGFLEMLQRRGRGRGQFLDASFKAFDCRDDPVDAFCPAAGDLDVVAHRKSLR